MLASYGEAKASALSRAACFDKMIAERCAFPKLPMVECEETIESLNLR